MLRTLLLVTAISCLALVGNGPLGSSTQAVNPGKSPQREEGVIKFRDPVRVLGVILQGEYIFVHDDERMARGEDCTAIYRFEKGTRGKPVVTFHCIPAIRTKVSSFTARTALVSNKPLLFELQEIQFPGSTEAHQVPSKAEAGSVTVNLTSSF